MNILEKTCIIWRIIDGKRGHERQTQGLAQALSAILPVRVFDVACVAPHKAMSCWLLRRFTTAESLPAPDLIIGAGHGTHFTMLAARRAVGGRAVVLMRPSLPLRCFDLCLIPEHDDAPPADNVMVTRGALNAVVFAANKQMQQGLMMIGGLSSHYCWDETSIVEQVKKIAQNTTIHWTLTTSPRTPVSTLEALLQCHMNNLQVVPFQQAKSDWLLEKISQVAQVWVTPDSVSMVYEACTSGAAVGLLALTEKAKNRVTHGLQDLVAEGRVTPYAEWLNGNAPAATAQQFNEAARCAARINQLWLS